MNPKLMAVWLLFPCDSTVVEDLTARTTTVISCPDTFGEAAGPFLAKGPPPPVASAPKPQAEAPFRKPILENSNKLSFQYEERKRAEAVKVATPPKKKKKRKKKRRR
jgi:hypothetical protein